jgi:hypothetical protein
MAAALVRRIDEQRPDVAVGGIADRERHDFAAVSITQPRPVVSIAARTSASVMTPEVRRFSRNERRTRWRAGMSAT